MFRPTIRAIAPRSRQLISTIRRVLTVMDFPFMILIPTVSRGAPDIRPARVFFLPNAKPAAPDVFRGSSM